MKKSQIYGQIFIYVLTLVVVSLILVYGYNSISNFKNRAEQVSCLKFKNDLRNSIKSILSDFGSVKKKDFQLCTGYSQVCFVESFNLDQADAPPDPIDPIIKDNVKSQTGRNAFLVDKLAKESFYAGNISVSPDIMCIKAINNKITLRLEGKGNHVLLSKG